jgi:hypothetical protein
LYIYPVIKLKEMIRLKQEPRELVIDLTGPKGNAFYLLAQADDWARQLGYTQEERDQLQADMTSGDYENLIQVFDKHFGNFVVLER